MDLIAQDPGFAKTQFHLDMTIPVAAVTSGSGGPGSPDATLGNSPVADSDLPDTSRRLFTTTGRNNFPGAGSGNMMRASMRNTSANFTRTTRSGKGGTFGSGGSGSRTVAFNDTGPKSPPPGPILGTTLHRVAEASESMDGFTTLSLSTTHRRDLSSRRASELAAEDIHSPNFFFRNMKVRLLEEALVKQFSRVAFLVLLLC
jgi:hypothetical protein